VTASPSTPGRNIWLNEGFATYTEWLWSKREGFGTADQIFNDFASIPPDEGFWAMAIGDPGPVQLFDFPAARPFVCVSSRRRELLAN
jgi:hypothetical protein